MFPQTFAPNSVELPSNRKPFSKFIVRVFQIGFVITLLLGVFISASLTVQAQSCTPGSSSTAGNFTLTFVSVTSGTGGQKTFTYTLTQNCSGGPDCKALSHIVVGMCDELTTANNYVSSSTPNSGWHFDGIGLDPTTNLYGIKFNLDNGALPPQTTLTFSFTLKPSPPTINSISTALMTWSTKAGSDPISSGTICGPDCSTAPTAVKLKKSSATAYADGTIGIEWKTAQEVRNLGFNVYREEHGQMAKLNPELIAGSALLTGEARLGAGGSYVFFDKGASAAARYWIEDIDLDKGSSWRGPIYLQKSEEAVPNRVQTVMLSQLTQSQSLVDSSAPLDFSAKNLALNEARLEAKGAENLQLSAASQNAIKIAIRKTGWYRIRLQDLVFAGLSAGADWSKLQLFTNNREQAMEVKTNADGSLTPDSAIEFFALAPDSVETNTRTYWLVVDKKGARVNQLRSPGSSTAATNFTATVERRDRFVYFSALLNGDAENFFGSVVTAGGTNQSLSLPNLDASFTGNVTLEISLQGVTQMAHRVAVQLNGNALGEVQLIATEKGIGRFTVPHTLLLNGTNTVRLTSLNGSADLNLVDYLRLSYQHTFTADNDQLRLTAQAGESLNLAGFTNRNIRVFDITNPAEPQELLGTISAKDGGFSVSLAVPAKGGQRSLLALTDNQALTAAALTANRPSTWKSSNHSADLVIVTPGEFVAALEPLKQARQAQGYQVAVVDIEDVYDEFNYGNKSVAALKDFLGYARSNWKVAPRYVLLVGDASYDRKNYLGFGNYDLIPSKSVNATFIEGASDGWFGDFNEDGVPELAIGRLPVRSATDTSQMVGKILGYANSTASDRVMLISGRTDGYNFENASASLKTVLPADVKVNEVRRNEVDTATAKAEIKAALDSGVKVMNYWGHGSLSFVQDNVLTSDDATTLTNEHLPVMVMMTCLTGYFHDALLETLAESWMKAPRGAIAVWASSGMTVPTGQVEAVQEFYKQLFTFKGIALGDAALRAKAATTDSDIRATWNLFGDPTLKLR
ncbi:MAG: C25 family cysteine peptidase [Acidobacteriota bacterium]